MKKANCLVMDLNEFDDILGASTNGMVGIQNEIGEWFYVSEEGYGDVDKFILEDLSNYLNEHVSKVYVDLTEMTAILYIS